MENIKYCNVDILSVCSITNWQ